MRQLKVDNSAEVFGDKVSIADLAQFSFNDLGPVSMFNAKRLLERDWKAELASMVERPAEYEIVAKFKDGSALEVAGLGADYEEFAQLPEHVVIQWVDGKPVPDPFDKPKWAKDQPPPEIGAEIVATINNCGPAKVVGYFVQHGWLGLRVELLEPPEWFVKQNKGNRRGHVFGPEFKMKGEAHVPA